MAQPPQRRVVPAGNPSSEQIQCLHAAQQSCDRSRVERRMKSLHELTGLEAAQAIAAGTITSEALVTACLERIAAREERVGAWEYLDPEAALAQARARDRSPAQGPLHGVPIGIKDLIDTADMPTSYGSPIYAGHR